MRLGVISDTHGWLDPRAVEHFAGVAAILHAGDIGAAGVIEALREIAPVYAVRGNVDRAPDVLGFPERLDVTLAGVPVHLVHRPVDARPGAARVVVTGHTHRPLVEWRGGVLWLNPGAAGRRGFHTERTLAVLDLTGARPHAAIIAMGPRGLKVRSPESGVRGRVSPVRPVDR